MAPPATCIKQHKRAMVSRYARSDDWNGVAQVLLTLVPLAGLWWLAFILVSLSYWLLVLAVVLITLFTLRCFALMHECGHLSLFRSRFLNRAVGFVLGVVSGMPQYVWSQHHNYHHANNGNWEKYRGPYTTLSVDEYAALTKTEQRLYRGKCSIAAAPIAGFIYLIFNPRFTWLMGSIALLRHLVIRKITQPGIPLRLHAKSFRTRYWKTPKEYWHMFWNNVVLLSGATLLAWLCGSATFFTVYVVSLSIAGGLGIVLFTVQHNFEHSYASETASWDYDKGAMEGTSFLVLPWWLNWFTLNIGYHHIHHISASIPGYRLVKCHKEYEHLFPRVTRLKLTQVHIALKCILWDARARRIISVKEYLLQPR
jgi:acyl-lipid omega-6 desaturase (Delta-12 desaturase)